LRYTRPTMTTPTASNSYSDRIGLRDSSSARLSPTRPGTGDPKRRAKMAACYTGKKQLPEVVEEMRRRMLGAKMSAATRRKMSKSHRARGTRPPAAGAPWTAAEHKLLRTLAPAEVVARTGRTLAAVYLRRHKLGMPDRRRR